MAILRSILILLSAQLVGEALHRALHIPLPGPVFGMALLAAYFLLRKREPDAALVQTSNGLLKWFGLLFIPAGAGVVAHLHLFRTAWFPIVVALFLSTALTIAVTALVMQWLLDRGQRVAINTEQQ
ncbi:MAG: CidA/LrgA family protein [Terriglobus sp.]